MIRQRWMACIMALSLGVLAACSSTPYAPVTAQVTPLDMTEYAPKVENFIVLLDTSGSMADDYMGRPKIQSAEDLVASFNGAVPPLDLKAALGIFGRGAGTCLGYGAATTVYGLSPYQSTDFAKALGSIECAASTTPIADAIDNTTQMLAEEKGTTAVIIVSDFKWNDPASVEAAVAQLKAEHSNKICLHTVKVGDDPMGDAVIASITGVAGCDSAVAAADITSGSEMSAFVADTLLLPVKKEMQYEKHTISAVTLFDFDKSVLKAQGKAALQTLGAEIHAQGATVGDVDVIGYTDSIGSESYNQALSMRRAMAVKDYLVSEGVSAGIIDAMGKGESDPVASNNTAEGRAENRRVEIHVGTSRPVK